MDCPASLSNRDKLNLNQVAEVNKHQQAKAIAKMRQRGRVGPVEWREGEITSGFEAGECGAGWVERRRNH